MKLLMKCISIILICFFSSASNAQKFDPAKLKNNIKVGLNNTYFEGDDFSFGVGWEFKVAGRQSLQIGISPLLRKDNYSKRNGFGLSIAYRKYISKNKEGLQGLYFSPGIKYGIVSENYTSGYFDYTNPTMPIYISKSITDKSNNFNASLLFGKQWVYKSGFSLDISGGLGIFNNKFTTDRPTSSTSYPYYYNNYNYNYNAGYGISPNLNITIGYAF